MKEVIFRLSSLFSDEEFDPGVKILDFSGLEGTCCYCSDEAASALRQAVLAEGPEGLHWIDTGDYHYLTLFFTELIDEPFELILLDNHADDFSSDTLSCGSWVPHVNSTPGSPAVYVSLDLDVLAREEFATNWDQGETTLDGMIAELRRRIAGRRVIGIDVCGGITESKGARPCDLALNLNQRERLRKILLSI